MVFSSLDFLFLFLPIFLIFYYIIPSKARNLLIFAGSVAFYAYGALEEPLYIVLLLLSVLVNFFAGKMISPGKRMRKTVFAAALIYNFSWLIVFKYSGFIFKNLNSLFGALKLPLSLPALSFVLPLGISFYTFQIVSYIIDVYREKISPEKSLINLGAYLTMFPQLIAGPIVKYSEISGVLGERVLSLNYFEGGLKTFTIGLGFKVLLANRLGALWSAAQTIGYQSISTPLACMAIIAFSLQIYFDFYGYSLMAVGLGKMLGFEFPKNFDLPYTAGSMTQFWRKWHITLGSWFREYVYIPLGGNRKGNGRTYLNLFIVWALTGLWHGASWNFAVWGLITFAIIAIEKLWLHKFLESHKILRHIYMIILIPLLWAVFAITDFSSLGLFFTRLFPVFKSGENIFSTDYIKYGKTYGVFLVLGIFFSTGIPEKLYVKIKGKIWETILLVIVFWLSVYCIFMGMNDPFLYFRF